MKIAIMVMAANAEPSTRNLDAIQNTLVKYQNEHKDRFKNEYDFYFYWSGGENMDEEVKVSDSAKYSNLKFVEVKEEESVYRTFEKSIRTFDYIHRNHRWYGDFYDQWRGMATLFNAGRNASGGRLYLAILPCGALLQIFEHERRRAGYPDASHSELPEIRCFLGLCCHRCHRAAATVVSAAASG